MKVDRISKEQSVCLVQTKRKPAFSINDNRPEALAQKSLVSILLNGRGGTVQRGRTKTGSEKDDKKDRFKARVIKDVGRELDSTKAGKSMRRRLIRIIGSLTGEYSMSKTVARNLLVATTRAAGRKKSYVLLSAGLGGPHPKFGGVSAAHTEQIWRGLWPQLSQPAVEAMYSSNQACNKNVSNPHGCESIPVSEMGLNADAPFFYSCKYATGANSSTATLGKVGKSVGLSGSPKPVGAEEYADDSDSDVMVDTEELREKDLEHIAKIPVLSVEKERKKKKEREKKKKKKKKEAKAKREKQKK